MAAGRTCILVPELRHQYGDDFSVRPPLPTSVVFIMSCRLAINRYTSLTPTLTLILTLILILTRTLPLGPHWMQFKYPITLSLVVGVSSAFIQNYYVRTGKDYDFGDISLWIRKEDGSMLQAGSADSTQPLLQHVSLYPKTNLTAVTHTDPITGTLLSP